MSWPHHELTTNIYSNPSHMIQQNTMGESTVCPGNIMVTIVEPLNQQPNSYTRSWYSAVTMDSWYWIHTTYHKNVTQQYIALKLSLYGDPGDLTHWSLNKMANICRWHIQFNFLKILVFWLKFYRSLFAKFSHNKESTLLKVMFCIEQATSHHPNLWCGY